MKKKSGRRLPPHVVLPNGMWRFVKTGSKARRQKRGTTMARGKAKAIYHRAGGTKGIMKMLAPALAGIADSKLDPILPVDGVAAAIGGYMAGDKALMTIGLYKAGASIGNMIPVNLPNLGGGGTQGGYV